VDVSFLPNPPAMPPKFDVNDTKTFGFLLHD
jgi:hypothetical protein